MTSHRSYVNIKSYKEFYLFLWLKAMIVSKIFSSMLHCNKLELFSALFFHLLKLPKNLLFSCTCWSV